MRHLTRAELEAGLEIIRSAPRDEGVLELIVRRPAIDAREVLELGELHPAHGLVGDTWSARGSSRTPDGTRHPDMRRFAAMLASEPRVSATAIQTVGGKGYDGFALALVSSRL